MSKLLTVKEKAATNYAANKDNYIYTLLQSHPDIYDHLADNLEFDLSEHSSVTDIVDCLHDIETDDNSSDIACIIGLISVIDKVIDQYCT